MITFLSIFVLIGLFALIFPVEFIAVVDKTGAFLGRLYGRARAFLGPIFTTLGDLTLAALLVIGKAVAFVLSLRLQLYRKLNNSHDNYCALCDLVH